MKKLLCGFLCFLVIFGCAGCGGQSADTGEETVPRQLTEKDAAYAWLNEKCLSLAGQFQEMLYSDAYFSLLYGDSLIEESIKEFRVQDYSKPQSVLLMRADEPLREEAAEYIYSEIFQNRQNALDSLPESLSERWQRTMYTSIFQMLAGKLLSTAMYAEIIAVRVGDSYPTPKGLTGPCFGVLRYDGPYSLFFTFTSNDHGVTSASCVVLPAEMEEYLAIPDALRIQDDSIQ